MIDQFGYYILKEVMKMMMEMVLSEEKAKKITLILMNAMKK